MNKNNLQDPDPFTIATLVAAGAALLLNLEQKVEARNTAKKNESDKKLRSELGVRLHRIKKSLAILQYFWAFFEESGQYQVDEKNAGNSGYGSARKYFTTGEYKEYNRRLDEALKHIGIINKELYAIKLDEIVLSDDLRKSFLSKIGKLRHSLNNLLQTNMDITERLQSVKHTILISSDLVDELYAAIGQINTNDIDIEGGEYF